MYSMARRIAPISKPGGNLTFRLNPALCTVWFGGVDCRELRNCSHCDLEVVGVDLPPNARDAAGRGRRDRGSRPHEWIEQNSLTKRQRCTNQSAKKGLWLQRWVTSNLAFESSRRRRVNQV